MFLEVELGIVNTVHFMPMPLCNSYIESAVVKYAQQAHKHYQYTQLPLLLLLVCV